MQLNGGPRVQRTFPMLAGRPVQQRVRALFGEKTMAVIYPKYRISHWVDTSEDAMSKEQVKIVYGVQTQRCRYGSWAHCRDGAEPLLYDSATKAANKCAELTKQDAAERERSNVRAKPDPTAART